MIIKVLLLAASVLIFLLLGPFGAITSNGFEWEMSAFALGFASMFPWPNP